VIEIHKMKASCMSIREIARQTGHDRNTIRKYLRTGELPRPKPGPPRGSKLDPFKEHVTARMAQGLLNANRLLEELRAMGYTGGKTVLKDFMKPLRPPPKPAAVLRFETAPGEQAHVDFGVFRYQDGTRTIRVAAFAMVLRMRLFPLSLGPMSAWSLVSRNSVSRRQAMFRMWTCSIT